MRFNRTPLLHRTSQSLLSLLLSAVITLASVAAARAEDPPEKAQKPLDPSSFVTLQFDNDFFGGSDKHFTNGMRAAYLSPEGAVPAPMRRLGEILPLFKTTYNMRFSFSIGQNIYTPANTTLAVPPTNDRPYAGWLYGGLGLVSDSGTWLDKLDVELGIVGPYSFARQTQTEWHRIFGFKKPRGWDYQLKTEPGLELYYERSRRSLFELPVSKVIPIQHLAFDFTPHAGVALGNVMTYGAAGFMGRFGKDLPADYGPPKIRPNLPGSDFFLPEDNFGWYFFGGVEGRVVGRNIFLDGNTFADSRSVDKIPVVADFQAGVALTFRRFRVSYTQDFRSPEFYGQKGFDDFGSLALSLRF